MRKWQLHNAKDKLDDLIEEALSGSPQCITKHGEEAVIVISMVEYEKLKNEESDLREFLVNKGPKFNNLEIERPHGVVRSYEV
ncbi:MAG: type II toxin-antitoxin system prevent-host-death family antitoxin [Rickettsiales bacterium]|nr:MAG: type II toxin-antitoxin system prevent-host-death family antitoxin [Rickettsiales bacterium]